MAVSGLVDPDVGRHARKVKAPRAPRAVCGLAGREFAGIMV
jgi:hypothetical protein